MPKTKNNKKIDKSKVKDIKNIKNINNNRNSINNHWYVNKNVLLISLSAFFADLGYQTVVGIFPILLVLILGASAELLGIASALAYGGGAAISYIGGVLGDRYGNKKIALLGNSFIPILSFIALAYNPIIAIMLFTGGWWARNFRTPSRRALQSKSTSVEDKSRAFGVLHLFDIGGGLLSISILITLLALGINLRTVLILTIIPLLLSTATLFLVHDVEQDKNKNKNNNTNSIISNNSSKGVFNGVIIATALYGFSSYSFAFPILTIAQKSNDLFGIASYGIFMGVSAIVGYYIGTKHYNPVKALALLGYLISSIGAFLLGYGYASNVNTIILYLIVAMLGFGMGVIETLEPTLIALVSKSKKEGRSMGVLSASRSIGIFTANFIMGILYMLNPFDSYSYAAIVALCATIILLFLGRKAIINKY
ncbi:MAG: MFS transporter [Candidatus Micrarchaeia archaeon]